MACIKPLAHAPGGDRGCGIRLLLEPSLSLHQVGHIRHCSWEIGLTARVLNSLELQRTVGASLADGALCMRMREWP